MLNTDNSAEPLLATFEPTEQTLGAFRSGSAGAGLGAGAAGLAEVTGTDGKVGVGTGMALCDTCGGGLTAMGTGGERAREDRETAGLPATEEGGGVCEASDEP